MKHISFFGSTIRETIDVLMKNDVEYDDIEYIDFSNPPSPSAPVPNPTSLTPDDPFKLNHDYDHDINTNAVSKVLPPKISLMRHSQHSTSIFEDKMKVIMRIVVTLILLTISIYLLIEKEDQSKTLPCSIISAVSGYWLK